MICAMCEVGNHQLCLNRPNVGIEGAKDAQDAAEIAAMLGAGQCVCTCGASIVKVNHSSAALRLVEDAADTDIQPIDDHALAVAFAEAAHLPRLVAATNLREREAVGAAIARLMFSCESGEDADTAALRIVARLGPDEALAATQTLTKWVLAIGAAADKAKRQGRT